MILFLKIKLVFAVSALFHDQVLFFSSSVGKIIIYLPILVVFKPRNLEKTVLDFSNNTFPIERRVLSTHFIIYGEFDLFMKIFDFIDHLETWWRHQKATWPFITILVFFERSYVVPHSCKASQGLTGLGFMEKCGGRGVEDFRPPLPKGYLIYKLTFVQNSWHFSFL